MGYILKHSIKYKLYTIAAALCSCYTTVIAQTDNDSIKTQLMNEVIVKGSHRIIKGDTISVSPSVNQQKFSTTGFELLRSMMFPGLRVNTIEGEVSLANKETVVILIDGRPVDKQDMLALRPKEVAKVEYIQNPGTEYGYDSSIGAIISIVKKQRTDGYAAGAILGNAVTTANGQEFLYGKYSKGNSEYTLSLGTEYTSLKKRKINDTNIYTIGEDAHKLEFQGINTPLKYSNNTLQAGYNHYIPGKHIFDITLKSSYYYSPDRAYKQQVVEDGAVPFFRLTEPYEKYLSPRLNIYYKKFINKKSTFTANFNTSYRHTNYHYDMHESMNEDLSEPDYSFRYGTKSNRESYIGELKYLYKFNRKIKSNYRQPIILFIYIQQISVGSICKRQIS